MAADPNKISFLSIPAEIRALVYNHVVACSGAVIFSRSDRRNYRLYPVHTPVPAATYFIVPAANLLLTCKATASEIKYPFIIAAHLHVHLSDLDNLFDYLPPWLATNLKQVTLYDTAPHASGPAFSPSLHANLHRTFADRKLSLDQYLLNLYPSLQTLNLTYFFPTILGTVRHTFSQHLQGLRDNELLNVARVAFKGKYDVAYLSAKYVTRRRTSTFVVKVGSDDQIPSEEGSREMQQLTLMGTSDHPVVMKVVHDAEKQQRAQLEVNIIAHVLEGPGSEQRRCVCLKYDLPDWKMVKRWTGADYHPLSHDKLGWHPHL